MIDIPDSVFPTDDKGGLLCPRCRQAVDDCRCPEFRPVPAKLPAFHPRIRLEKKGRKGKAVTLIEGLPPDHDFLEQMSRRLKQAVGAGGTCYLENGAGVIELQGDRREALSKSGLMSAAGGW